MNDHGLVSIELMVVVLLAAELHEGSGQGGTLSLPQPSWERSRHDILPLCKSKPARI